MGEIEYDFFTAIENLNILFLGRGWSGSMCSFGARCFWARPPMRGRSCNGPRYEEIDAILYAANFLSGKGCNNIRTGTELVIHNHTNPTVWPWRAASLLVEEITVWFP